MASVSFPVSPPSVSSGVLSVGSGWLRVALLIASVRGVGFIVSLDVEGLTFSVSLVEGCRDREDSNSEVASTSA